MSEEAHLIAPKPVRSPLNTATNTQPTTPALLASDKNIEKGKKVRRKSSFVRRLDSSEDLPSSHDSIFIAEYLSPYNSEEDGYKLENWEKIESQQTIPLSPRLELPNLSLPSSPSSEHDENGNQRLSIGITPILYGYGTPLTTIIEQKSSNPTLRGDEGSTTSATRSLPRPRSVSDVTSSAPSSIRHYHSTTTNSSPLRNLKFSKSGIIRRLESLSSSEDIKLSWPPGYNPHPHSQRAAFSIRHRHKSGLDLDGEGGSESAPGSPINEIYAQPLRPLQPPVQRPGTPEGMPSWTAAQGWQPRAVVNAQGEVRRGWGIHEASCMLQRLFSNCSLHNATAGSTVDAGGEAEPTTRSGYGIRGPWDGVPNHRRAVSAPVLRGAPRFRAPRSAHGVAMLEMHPFARASGVLMGGKGDSVDLLTPLAPGAVIPPTPAAGRVPVALVDEAAASTATPTATTTGHRNRNLSLRNKGKRKPGQRVRFTPSTADPSAISHRESGTFQADVKVCPHRAKKSKDTSTSTRDGQMWDVSEAPLAGARGAGGAAPGPRPMTMMGIEPERDGLSMNPVPPVFAAGECQVLPFSLPLSSHDGVSTPVPAHGINEKRQGFSARNRCWKCRLVKVVEGMDGVLEATGRWAGWVCCGIEDVDRGNGEVGERGRNGRDGNGERAATPPVRLSNAGNRGGW